MANKFAIAGPGSKFQEPEAEPAGFWAGVWHGMSMPITLIISLFNPDVRIYETHNTGKSYDIGFVIGASMALGGGKKGAEVNVKGPQEEEEVEIHEEA
ncbi:MAG: hypothetical protein JXA33_29695 [Anaerolineae bacterium]|nr:hypothetical protein [Anaerolineae bacterium]